MVESESYCQKCSIFAQKNSLWRSDSACDECLNGCWHFGLSCNIDRWIEKYFIDSDFHEFPFAHSVFAAYGKKWNTFLQIMAAKSRETGTAAVRQGHRPPPTPRPMQPPAEVDGDEYMDDPDTATMEDLIRDDSEIQQVIDDATC